jgi:pyruvyltransferase
VTKRGARSNLPASLRERTQSQTEKGRRRKSTFQADRSIKCLFLTILIYLTQIAFADVQGPSEGLPLYYWNEKWHGRIFENFGDIISLKLVERIVGGPVRIYKKGQKPPEKKLLAIGSLLYFANNNDVLWGTGTNGKFTNKKDFKFTSLDIRAIRGPLTRQFLWDTFQIQCPEIYGDPALLFPYFFPEFKRKDNPIFDYIIIPHYSEEDLFLKEEWDNVVYSTEPWNEILEKILNSRFVISSSLHGVILAEAYGIPARLLVVSKNEPLFKYYDYYLGTNRPHFQYATSVDEAMEMGGESPFDCDLKKLYEAFPFEFWPNVEFRKSTNLNVD